MLSGCGAGDPPAPITAVPIAPKVEVSEDPVVQPQQPPDIDLRPLPTPAEVMAAAPGGRQDPFQPLPLVAIGASADGAGDAGIAAPGALLLTGVIEVGGIPRALVRVNDNTSVLCLGSGGRCDGDADALLPEGWSVIAIDIAAACVQLSLEGDAQDPVCIV